MKRLVLLLACFFASSNINSQEFGVKGGLNITFFKATEDNFGTNPSEEIGYYGGVFVDIEFKDKLHLQPELLFIRIRDFQFLNAPIYLEYDINNKAHVLVGPSLNYFFDFFSNKFKVRVDLGFSYDLTQDFSIHMKYTLGFEELSPNIIFLGVGYKL
ncbi:porin family protein [Winogradskyella sp.]|uniref:porin family protein n=1 Tax=Winogradskyella sp. TaxID=1883156 RepID=UPI0025EC097D|nr:porin family protein [Winogradskyella sp.]MCT4628612.1 PorT family protein [Winogradskyella sp.]